MATTNHHSLDLPQAWPWKAPTTDHHHYQYHYYVQGQCHQMMVREHLFEKPLTPSDVGKLNRLVIPKQHAEKHFPLDAESGEKGLLLSFEDEAGKSWRFRYSYWTSSQSYVLTKGWSRFVKDKRLDAGDIVLFERRRSDAGRLHIGWRRRGEPPAAAAAQWAPPVYYGSPHQPYGPGGPSSASSQMYFVGGATATATSQDCYIQGGGGGEQGEEEEKRAASKYSKRLRLFGVNLDCSGLDGADSPDGGAQQQMELHQFMPCTGHGGPQP